MSGAPRCDARFKLMALMSFPLFSSAGSRALGHLHVVLAICISVASAMSSTDLAVARDDGRYAKSPLRSWFETLHSGRGEQCCADVDGLALSDVDWDTKDNHYRVRIENEWIDVPDDVVITEPNRSGRTIVWPFYLDGRPTVRCFLPGSMT